jgi:serine/threonine-protein kinase HipA
MSAKAIEVRIWGSLVGAVALDPASGHHVFEYSPAWTRKGIELAPFTMPVAGGKRTFVFPRLAESFHGLPGLLADSLPDAFGHAIVDAWMAREGISASSVTPLDRLAYMGHRGMGALEFRPAKGARAASGEPLEMKSLVEAVRSILQGTVDSDAHTQTALANIIQVGTSAGGARAKAVIAWNPSTKEIRAGQFGVPAGFEHWLLKFDGTTNDREGKTPSYYGRTEYAFHLMARAAGIEMAPCHLLEENGRAHFMTKRFDRDGPRKHHVQTLCALRHLGFTQLETHSYEQYLQTVRELDLGDDALRQAFRRMAFNVMARNCDDHTKNLGFLMREGQGWELAPAYDLIPAYNPRGVWTYQHAMSVNGRFDGISRADLLAVSDRFFVPSAKDTIKEVRASLENWGEFSAAAGVPEEKSQRVKDAFRVL